MVIRIFLILFSKGPVNGRGLGIKEKLVSTDVFASWAR